MADLSDVVPTGSILDADQTEVQPYDWWERRIRFDVRQYVNSDHGVVHIPTKWDVQGADEIVQLG